MSDGGRRKVDGNDVFLLPNRRIRPNSTKTSTILLNFVDQIVDRFWKLKKHARQLEKADTAPRISGHGTQKIPPYQLKAPPEMISEGAV